MPKNRVKSTFLGSFLCLFFTDRNGLFKRVSSYRCEKNGLIDAEQAEKKIILKNFQKVVDKGKQARYSILANRQ